MQLDKILVVDDNPVDLKTVSIACSCLDCDIEAVSDPLEALESFERSRHQLVLSDYRMEPIDGVELIKRLREIDARVNCLLMTGYLDARVNAYANDHMMNRIITKPIRPANLAEQLRVALHKHRGATEQLNEITTTNRMDRCVALLGQSPQICQVRRQISKLINVNGPIFIEGPFGVGKPDIVRFIHNSGRYAKSSLVFCPCQDLTDEELERKLIDPDGVFGTYIHEAEYGMLTLNHIESIPIELQQVLARNLDRISQKCRIVTWANAMMDDLLQMGKIDEELYFAMSLDTIHVPALRERPADIEEIARYVAASPEEFSLDQTLTMTELDLLVANLRRSELDGNLRELIQEIRTASRKVEAHAPVGG